jgi:hypothetical protein
VQTNSSLDDASVIVVHPLIPQLYSVYVVPNGFDFGAVCRKVTPVQDPQSPYVWTVTAEYSTKAGDQSRYDPNPLLRPPTIRWSSQKFQKDATQDIQGNPIVTSAGEAYDPPRPIDDSRMILTVVRNESSYDPGLAQLYTNATNFDVFFGALAGQCKCDSIQGELKFETGIYYWEVTYVFHFRTGTDSWVLALLDEGSYYHYETGFFSGSAKFIDNYGKNVRGLLDGNGGKLSVIAALNDVQTVTITGSPTGGSVSLGSGPLQNSVSLAYNYTAAQVQTSVQAQLAAGATCTVTGGPLPGTAVAIQFTGNLAAKPQTVMSISNTLTGGTSPNATIAHSITGAPAGVPHYNSFVVYRVLPFAIFGLSPNA